MIENAKAIIVVEITLRDNISSNFEREWIAKYKYKMEHLFKILKFDKSSTLFQV